MNYEKVDRVLVERLLQEVEEAMEDVEQYTSKPFNGMSEAERYAVRYCLIVLVEALTSLSIHITRRVYGEKPETPLHCFRILRDRGLLTTEEFDDFIKLFRLRNLLVHRYWVIDDKKIYDSVKNNFRCLRSFLDRVRRLVRSG